MISVSVSVCGDVFYFYNFLLKWCPFWFLVLMTKEICHFQLDGECSVDRIQIYFVL